MALPLPTVRDPEVQQALNVIASQLPVIKVVTALPSSGQQGAVIFNAADSKHYGFNGTEWKAFY